MKQIAILIGALIIIGGGIWLFSGEKKEEVTEEVQEEEVVEEEEVTGVFIPGEEEEKKSFPDSWGQYASAVNKEGWYFTVRHPQGTAVNRLDDDSHVISHIGWNISVQFDGGGGFNVEDIVGEVEQTDFNGYAALSYMVDGENKLLFGLGSRAPVVEVAYTTGENYTEVVSLILSSLVFKEG
ncbi:MAG: hypothetical protein ACJKSS_01895 [Patescibacteria group bacterium UBA2103]